MLKILYVTTISNTVNAFLIPHINMLIEQGHQVDVAFNIVQDVDPEIVKMGCTVNQIEFQRSPLNYKNVVAYKKLRDLITSEKYDLVHTHTPTASAIVRLACRNIEKVKVIYTAHGFHFYKGAPIQNWLIYYPIEKWLSKYTDLLITINNEDFERAKLLKANRVEYIPGVGLNTKVIQDVMINKQEKRKDLGIPDDAFLLLSVGELNENKNHETIIKALAELGNKKVYYIICGQGQLESYLKKLIIEFDLNKQIKLIGFRNDIVEICKATDLFVFPSHREGLPVSIMEAMASGLPIVCSNIRGNIDLVEQEKGGYLVEPNDINGFAKAIRILINDQTKLDQYSQYNLLNIKKFDFQNINEKMKSLYNLIKGENRGT